MTWEPMEPPQPHVKSLLPATTAQVNEERVRAKCYEQTSTSCKHQVKSLSPGMTAPAKETSSSPFAHCLHYGANSRTMDAHQPRGSGFNASGVAQRRPADQSLASTSCDAQAASTRAARRKLEGHLLERHCASTRTQPALQTPSPACR